MTIPNANRGLVEALERIRDGRPAVTNSTTAHEQWSWACAVAATALASISGPEGGMVPAEAADLITVYVPVAVHYPEADTLEFVLRDVPTISAYALPSLDSLHDLETREPIGWRIRGWSKIAPAPAPATQAEREAVKGPGEDELEQRCAKCAELARLESTYTIQRLVAQYGEADNRRQAAEITLWAYRNAVAALMAAPSFLKPTSESFAAINKLGRLWNEDKDAIALQESRHAG